MGGAGPRVSIQYILSMTDVLITTVSFCDGDGCLDIQLPSVEHEADVIRLAFGARAATHSNISVAQLGELLAGKRIWFFSGHGDAVLQGEHVLAFRSPSGGIEAVSINTIAATVRPHVQPHGLLRCVVLTGCKTARLGEALCEHACVPDVVCWDTLVEDQAALLFSAGFATAAARQHSQLDPAAAFLEARAAVGRRTERGLLDNGRESVVQLYELDVDPENIDAVHTCSSDPPQHLAGRLRSKSGEDRAQWVVGRLAAGTPRHLKAAAPAAHATAPATAAATPSFFGKHGAGAFITCACALVGGVLSAIGRLLQLACSVVRDACSEAKDASSMAVEEEWQASEQGVAVSAVAYGTARAHRSRRIIYRVALLLWGVGTLTCIIAIAGPCAIGSCGLGSGLWALLETAAMIASLVTPAAFLVVGVWVLALCLLWYFLREVSWLAGAPAVLVALPAAVIFGHTVLVAGLLSWCCIPGFSPFARSVLEGLRLQSAVREEYEAVNRTLW